MADNDAIQTSILADRITRERTYNISHKRADKKDAIAQIMCILNEAFSGTYAGQVIINYHQGHISSVNVVETQRVSADSDKNS